MERSIESAVVPDIRNDIPIYEDLCLEVVAKACAEVRKLMPEKKDIFGSLKGSSFAFVAGGWTRDKVSSINLDFEDRF